jgi:uroporphyrin-III C-methyltransferase
MSYNKGIIYLVGAGPGDPELLTLKATKALKKAEVILYDALVHPDVLDWADQDAVKIYVGKRKGHHALPQDEINALMVDYALQGKVVVRLKGGDPYVFGRGHEELTYAKTFGIPVEVVPGISSAIAVPQGVGIPVTRRGESESFWVITATTKTGSLSKDIAIAARSSATLVILMGVSKLPQIVDIFHGIGKQDTPIAIIQNGSLENEQSVAGNFNNIEQLVEENGIGNPAIIIIGEVAKHHPNYIAQVLPQEILAVA